MASESCPLHSAGRGTCSGGRAVRAETVLRDGDSLIAVTGRIALRERVRVFIAECERRGAGTGLFIKTRPVAVAISEP